MNELMTNACVLEVNEFVLTVGEYGEPYNLYDLEGQFNLESFSIGDIVSFTYREKLLSNGNKSKQIIHIEKRDRT